MQNDSTRVVTTVRLPSELLERIDEVARDQRRSRSGQIEFILSTAVDSPRQHHGETVSPVPA